MLIERLKLKFKLNEPIFTTEILDIMKDYSRFRIYQLIKEAELEGKLFHYDNGIYYLPKETEFGKSIPTVNSVVDKKYINYNGNTFGIYGRSVLELNFLISYQVPNVIEVITNNESRNVREIEIRGRKVVLRKSRLTITNDNAAAYTIMELFNDIDLTKLKENDQIRNSIIDYIKDNNITRTSLLNIAEAFPAKAIKNLTLSGVLYEITQ